MKNIEDLLKELGFPVENRGNYLKIPCLWRDGKDINSGTVYENCIIDHVEGTIFSLEELIKKILKLDSDEKVNDWLKNKQYQIPQFNPNQEPIIKQIKKFNQEIANSLIPDFSYFTKSGISEETCKSFKGGLCLKGSLKNRQCLLIFNSKNDIVGITGRDFTDKKKIKWMHHGAKTSWVWPAYLNNKIIQQEREVILVESPRCILKLWDCGIRNVLCLFGTDISNSIINYLLRINPNKIYISTNNEPDNKNIGNNAADKIQKRLLKYFDYKVVDIKLPVKKDFGEMCCVEIKEWIK